MTEIASVTANTHPTTESYPVAASLNSPVPNGTVSDSVPAEDDEPYTIKCICAFEDDDGNTVFCEGCETWQHIECYYHGREVPEIHNCTDCEPRHLDGKRATERQRRLREQSDGGDRKAKRSGSKTSRKKASIIKDQPSQDQPNGYHPQRSESTPRDQPPAKKVKTNHKSSASVNSLSAPPLLSSDPRKRSGSAVNPLSPAKSFSPPIPLYSHEFLHLYEDDRGHVDNASNLWLTLSLMSDATTWLKDSKALALATNGRTPHEVFTPPASTFDPTHWPTLSINVITDSAIEIDGRHPTWKALRTEGKVAKDEIAGEVKGKIGSLRDYCLDARNRWSELHHPQPFVFFHPQLPIYIDGREEGSILRYIRRSCRPNVTMKTYITNDSEYHFCFVANQDIPAGAELTAMWYLDPGLFEGPNGVVKQESGEGASPDVAAICISNVLSHFGGCACNPSQNCLLAKVDRRRLPSTKPMNGRRKKSKSKSNVSPTATVRASNSRAGSEGIKPEDEDQADSRSTSGSLRGQSRSRDLTPVQTSNDNGLGPMELSAREKRKLAAVEKKFEQLDQDQQFSNRKKKRGSGASAQTTPSVGTSKQTGYFGNIVSQTRSLYIDAVPGRQSPSPPSLASPGTVTMPRQQSPRKTSGPNTPSVRSPLGQPQYVDVAIQTDPNEMDADFVPPVTPVRKHHFVPLTQRLLKRCHEDRVRFESSGSPGLHSPTSLHGALSTSPTLSSSEFARPFLPQNPSLVERDVEMKDADTEMTPPSGRAGELDQSGEHVGFLAPDPPGKSPFPSAAAHINRVPQPLSNGVRSGLYVQLPHNNFSATFGSNPGFLTPGSLQSPNLDAASAASSLQTPGGTGITAPSPVKKKLSLGDYLSRRGTLSTPTSEKAQSQGAPLVPSQSSPQNQAPSPGPSSDLASQSAQGPDGVKVESPLSIDTPMKDVSKPPLSPPEVLASLDTADSTKAPSTS